MSMSKEELIIGFFEKGYCCDLDEVKNTCLDLLRENREYKEVIDKAIETLDNYQNNLYSKSAREFLDDDIERTITILKEVK